MKALMLKDNLKKQKRSKHPSPRLSHYGNAGRRIAHILHGAKRKATAIIKKLSSGVTGYSF
jgi:hypothetical protein